MENLNLIEANESILIADDNFQVYNLYSAEDFNLKQLESKKKCIDNFRDKYL